MNHFHKPPKQHNQQLAMTAMNLRILSLQDMVSSGSLAAIPSQVCWWWRPGSGTVPMPLSTYGEDSRGRARLVNFARIKKVAWLLNIKYYNFLKKFGFGFVRIRINLLYPGKN